MTEITPDLAALAERHAAAVDSLLAAVAKSRRVPSYEAMCGLDNDEAARAYDWYVREWKKVE